MIWPKETNHGGKATPEMAKLNMRSAKGVSHETYWSETLTVANIRKTRHPCSIPNGPWVHEPMPESGCQHGGLRPAWALPAADLQNTGSQPAIDWKCWFRRPRRPCSWQHHGALVAGCVRKLFVRRFQLMHPLRSCDVPWIVIRDDDNTSSYGNNAELVSRKCMVFQRTGLKFDMQAGIAQDHSKTITSSNNWQSQSTIILFFQTLQQDDSPR